MQPNLLRKKQLYQGLVDKCFSETRCVISYSLEEGAMVIPPGTAKTAPSSLSMRCASA